MKQIILAVIAASVCIAAQPAPDAERQEIAMTKCSRDVDMDGCSPVCKDEEEAEKEERKSDEENFVPEKPRKGAARRVVEGD